MGFIWRFAIGGLFIAALVACLIGLAYASTEGWESYFPFVGIVFAVLYGAGWAYLLVSAVVLWITDGGW